MSVDMDESASDLVARQLDEEITDLQDHIASLKRQLKVQATNLLSAESTRQLLQSPSQRSDPLALRSASTSLARDEILSRSKAQEVHDEQNLYRIAAGITSFRVQDPDPNAVDGGKVLGLRFEVISRARFLRPYYVMLNRPYPGSRHLRVHRHTVPTSVPLAGLAARHLPAPEQADVPNADVDADAGPAQDSQDLGRFARELRREIVRYHNRAAAIGNLGEAIKDAREAATDDDERDGMLADVRAADPQGKQVDLEWADGRTGRLVMGNDGQLEKLVVYKMGSRDHLTQRELVQDARRVEDVVRLVESKGGKPMRGG